MENSFFLRRLEDGQGLVEYAVLIVFMAIAVMVSLSFLSSGIVSALYNNIINNL